MDYDDAEEAGRDRQDSDGTPPLAQWARAEALKALMSNDSASRLGMQDIADRANWLAELIVSGSLPKPPAGVRF